MDYIIVALVSYLIGSINLSILLTKQIQGVDIRDVNSHSAGASNTTLTLGFKYGVVVFLFDVLKGFIPVFVVKLLYPDQDILWFLAGFMAMIGHTFPVYYHFKGGKGTSAYLGVVLAAFPLLGLILFVLLVGMAYLSNYVVIGTLFLILPPPIYMIITGEYHWISIALLSTFVLINLFKHSNNFVALFKGEEVGVRAGLNSKSK